MKKVLIVIFGIILMLGSIGCSQSSSAKESEKVSIRGQITKSTQSADKKTVTILVEGEKEEDTEFDKASVTVNTDTKIYRGDSKEKLNMADLVEGIKVEVYWNGPVLESYPVQIGANTIRVIQ